MENHPIPQDVTGFKFKLIGSITVKQFLYLLGFGILTTVVFAVGLNIFIKIPLMVFLAGTGAAFAFVPIEGRPMDVMIINFAKTIPSENRYIFRKRGVNLAQFMFLQIPEKPHPAQHLSAQTAPATNEHDEKKSLLLKKLNNSAFKPDEEETRFFNNVKSFFSEGVGATVIAPTVQKLPDKLPEEEIKQQVMPVINADSISAETPISQPEQAEENIEKIQEELSEAKKLQHDGVNPQNMEARIKALEEQLQSALSEKEELSKKVVEYESDKFKKQENVVSPSQAEEPKESQSVRFIAPSASLKAGFPSLPDIPNVVLGIVEDARGKTLPNILVEVVDENSIPVRAFKTNALGQFASVTPLANGTYKVYFEDPAKQHEFEIIEISLNGEIFNPIEVKSVDAREKLRRELFDGTGAANQATA